MVHDRGLADRVRVLVHALDEVGPGRETFAALVELEHGEPMTMGSRTSDSWVRVAAEALTRDGDLADRVARGAAASTSGP